MVLGVICRVNAQLLAADAHSAAGGGALGTPLAVGAASPMPRRALPKSSCYFFAASPLAGIGNVHNHP